MTLARFRSSAFLVDRGHGRQLAVFVGEFVASHPEEGNMA